MWFLVQLAQISWTLSIKGGKRLECPKEVSEVRDLRNLFHDITQWCWQRDHSLRWNFTSIVAYFTCFLTKDEVEEKKSIEDEFNLNFSTADSTTLKKRPNSKNPQYYSDEISLKHMNTAKKLWARMKNSVHCCKTDSLSTEDTNTNLEGLPLAETGKGAFIYILHKSVVGLFRTTYPPTYIRKISLHKAWGKLPFSEPPTHPYLLT